MENKTKKKKKKPASKIYQNILSRIYQCVILVFVRLRIEQVKISHGIREFKIFYQQIENSSKK